MTKTTTHIFVVPFNEAVIGKTNGRLAVRTTNPGDIDKIIAVVSRDRLHCIEVSSESLASIDLKKEWIRLPLLFRLKRAGRLLDCIPALENMRNSAARFYFPATTENIIAVRVLSSLMVKTGLIMDRDNTDWEAMEDLLAYDAFGKVAHVSVEPFFYAYTEHKNLYADYKELYLEKEGTFFHCDEKGNISLSSDALGKGDFIGTLDKADTIDFGGFSLSAREKRRTPQLKFGGCSVCPAWRVCGFRKTGNEDNHCAMKQFMTALLESAGEVSKNADNNI
jgi:hypothetical protein